MMPDDSLTRDAARSNSNAKCFVHGLKLVMTNDDSIADGLSVTQGSSERGFIKGVFVILGVGVLLPWNAFVSAKPYFQARLCTEASGMSANIELWFGFVYNLSSVLSLASIILLQWWKDKKQIMTLESIEMSAAFETPTTTPTDNKTLHDRNYWMIVIPLSAYLIVFFLTTLLVLFPKVPTFFFLMFTLVGLCICGVCTAFASAGIVGTAGMFPSCTGINPYFSGQAIGGVAVSCANFMAAGMEDPKLFRESYCKEDGIRIQAVVTEDAIEKCVPYHEIDWASFSYFLLGSIVLAICILGYSYIDKYQRSTAQTSYESLAETDASRVNNDNVHASARGNIELPDQGDESSGLDEPIDPSSKALESNDETSDEMSIASVFDVVKAPAFSIFMVFFVTLSLFPGWTSQLKSVHECSSHIRLFNDLYTPLSFVIFNFADLAGRVLSGYIHLDQFHHVSSKLVAISASRLVFFPLFLVCVARDSAYANAAFPSDLFSLLVQIAFGMGNGMVTTLSFMHAPTLLPTIAETQTRASEILNLALSFGLLCGSISSFPFSRIATGHW
jgi:hypothetical protein